MKKNVRKNVLLSLSLLSLGALAVGGMAWQNSGFVTANAENAFSESVDMFYGAKVRIQVEENDPTGIRFGAKLTDYSAEHNYTYGMLVIPTDYLTTYADEIAAASNDYVKAFASVVVDNGDGTTTTGVKIADMTCYVNTGDFDEDGSTENYIQGSLVTLKYANLNRGFTGIAYIKDADNNYLYSEVSVSRSVSYVASVALHDYASDTASAGYQTCLKYLHGGVNLKNEVDGETGYTTSSSFAISAELTDGKISVTQSPAMGYAVKYATENADVATVDAEGNVTLVGVGTAEITVKCIDRTETVSVTVTEADMLKMKMSALNAQTLTKIEDGEFTYDASTGTLTADMKGTQDYRPILWKDDTTASGNFTASTFMKPTKTSSSVAPNTMNGITLAFMGDDGSVKALSFAGKWVGGNGSLKLSIGGTAGAAETTIDGTQNNTETGELLKVINAEGELSKEYSLRFSQGLTMNVIRAGDTLTVNWVNKTTSTERGVFKATYQNNVLTTQYYNSSNVWTDTTCSDAVQSVLKDLLANANETVMMGLTARSLVNETNPGVNGMTYSDISLVENGATPAQILNAKLIELGANTLTNLPTGFTYADNKLTTTLTVTEDVYPIVWTDEAAVEGNFTASVDMAATINSNTVNMNTKNGIALVFVGEDGSLKVLTFAGKWNTSGSAVNFDVSAVAGATSTTINAVQTDTEKNRTEISSISTDNLYNLRFNAVSMKVVRADNTLTVSLIDKNDTERGVFKATYASGVLTTQYYSSSNEWTDVSCATDIQAVFTELLTNESETVMMGLTARAYNGKSNGMTYSNISLAQN